MKKQQQKQQQQKSNNKKATKVFFCLNVDTEPIIFGPSWIEFADSHCQCDWFTVNGHFVIEITHHNHQLPKLTTVNDSVNNSRLSTELNNETS